MVVGPSLGYAQMGYLENEAGYPNATVFVEKHLTQTDPNVHRLYRNALTYGTTYTYEAVVGNNSGCAGGGVADYYFDGAYLVSQCLDWNTGSRVEVAAETHSVYNFIPFIQYYSNAAYCIQPSVGTKCRAASGYPVSAGNNLNPAHPYGCYSRSGTYTFSVMDKRDNNGQCL